MVDRKLPWSNPYKTRLWFGSQDGELGNHHLKELFNHILGGGPKGCRDLNAQLSAQIHRSRATVKRYLHTLEKHHLIEIVPGWAELSGGSFRKTLRYRRIYALPWPNRASWMAASYQKLLEEGGSKMSHYKKSTKKLSINQQRYDLFYTRPGPKQISEASEAEAGVSDTGLPAGSTDCCSGGRAIVIKQLRKQLIERLLKIGHSREDSIRFADIKIKKIQDQQKSDHKNQQRSGNAQEDSKNESTL